MIAAARRRELAADAAFCAVAALLFAGSVLATGVGCASMAAMGAMPMAGGWTLSMSWMRMPGQTWPGAAASFLGMWLAMMVAMKLPSLLPLLWRYRQALGEPRRGRRTLLVGAGYFVVWTAIGAALFALGVTLAALELRQPLLARAVPFAGAAVVLVAGGLQCTAWKRRHLDCYRRALCPRNRPSDGGAAFADGLRLGLQCSRCCAGPMAILVVLGVMDLGAMAVVAVAITVERLVSPAVRVAQVNGALAVAAGLVLLVRACTFG